MLCCAIFEIGCNTVVEKAKRAYLEFFLPLSDFADTTIDHVAVQDLIISVIPIPCALGFGP